MSAPNSEPRILKVPSVVPNGIYRFRSSARFPNVYLQWEIDNHIRLHEYKANERRQEWKISSKDDDDLYVIHNIFSELNITTVDYQDEKETKQALICGDREQTWSVEPRGDAFVIGVVGNGKCIDLAQDNTPFIWERNNLMNQRWVLEIVEPPKPAVKWVTVSDGVFPSNAILGGQESDGRPLYVARAFVPGADSYQCGKARPGLQPGLCLLPYDGSEQPYNTFEVLIGDSNTVTWVSCDGSNVDPASLHDGDGHVLRAIEGGSSGTVNPLYVIQAPYSGSMTPGEGTVNSVKIGYDGQVQTIHGSFKVLCQRFEI